MTGAQRTSELGMPKIMQCTILRAVTMSRNGFYSCHVSVVDGSRGREL